jgi:hypothetical protein
LHFHYFIATITQNCALRCTALRNKNRNADHIDILEELSASLIVDPGNELDPEGDPLDSDPCAILKYDYMA